MQISFANNATAGNNCDKIQFQVVPGDELFDNTSPQNLYEILKESGYARITGLITGAVYKVRARYRNSTGTISGPWSKAYYTVNIGKNENGYAVPSITMDLDRTFIVAKPPQDLTKPSDFDAYEYRIYKDTGTEDFWEIVPDTINNIKVQTTANEARFNLLDMPTPRISTAGITYRVACRAKDRSGNYSAESALGTIVVKTIQ